VDEFQDTNMAQYNLLKHLASFHENLFVVGDADQSIYRWRGADYRNVLRFEQDYPAAQVILLEQNYRSTQNILDTAMAVIEHNENRTQKQLFTERGIGFKPVIRELYDDREEAAFIVERVKDLVEGDGLLQFGDIAVMYRINAQSRVLEEAFLANDIPYKLVGAQRFYGRREVKDIVAYLRLVHNPRDEVSLQRVINTPTRGIGDKTYTELYTLATKTHIPAGEILLDLGDGETSKYLEHLSNRAGSFLSRFGMLLFSWVSLREKENPLTLMDRVLEDVDYRAYIDDGTEEGHSRWENIMELRRLAGEYRDLSLTDFLENIALVSDQDTVDPEANAATLLTLHAAKGLEYPAVFIVGLNEGTLPHFRSFEEAEEMEDECRLLYVGVTRAKDHLYLLHTLNRYSYGYSEPASPSRFLDGISPSLLDSDRPMEPRRRTFISQEWESPVTTTEPSERKYHPGMKVGHDIWGEGLVLKSVLEDDDEIVDIFFESVGLKRVAASIAKLEVAG
jgi:DNA helicase-2/ATP-dependent DNA helicase PcrA